MTIEDQLTKQRNWNLHPSNSNPDMTGLKDKYRSGEENHLGKTGQVRMEVNVVTAPVRPTQITLFDMECEDTLKAVGNGYSCNKPRHMKRLPGENPNSNPSSEQL